jgi:hypothetical protein
VWLREIEAPTALAELEASAAALAPMPAPQPVEEPVPAGAASRARVEQLASDKPELLAQQVKAWMGS